MFYSQQLYCAINDWLFFRKRKWLLVWYLGQRTCTFVNYESICTFRWKFVQKCFGHKILTDFDCMFLFHGNCFISDVQMFYTCSIHDNLKALLMIGFFFQEKWLLGRRTCLNENYKTLYYFRWKMFQKDFAHIILTALDFVTISTIVFLLVYKCFIFILSMTVLMCYGFILQEIWSFVWHLLIQLKHYLLFHVLMIVQKC